MVVTTLHWLRSDAGRKMHLKLRRRLLWAHRPPRWWPCWFYSLWHLIVERTVTFSLIIGHRGSCDDLYAVLQTHRCPVDQRLDGVGFVCTRAPLGALYDLCCCPSVARIWLDAEVKACLDTAVPSAGAVRSISRYKGRGVTIAIIDTGIYPHPDLEGRIVAFADMVGNKEQPYDDNGHGTHVAGCAAGSGGRSEGRYRGLAPGALLVGVKVLNKVGMGQMSDLLAGIEWVIQHKERYNIRIMSLSLGGESSRSCADDPLCRAVEAAWKAGIVVLAAAGNDGPETGTVGTPGISPMVITVGAMDDRGTPDQGDDELASFSSRGPAPGGMMKPDVVAPGVAITSLRSPGSLIDKQHREARTDRDYTTLSGTSMATPIVAGLVALLLEAEPGLTPDAVKQRLMGSARHLDLLLEEQGAGHVDADRMLLDE